MAKELAKGIEAQGRSKSYHRRYAIIWMSISGQGINVYGAALTGKTGKYDYMSERNTRLKRNAM